MPMPTFLPAFFATLVRSSVAAIASVLVFSALPAQAQLQPQVLGAPPAPPVQSTPAGAGPLSSGEAVPSPEASHLAVVRERAEARARIQAQRQSTEAALQQGQAACYQRFAVEDCLNAERRRTRKAQALLAQQEAVLDETERRERAAERLKDIAGRTPAPAVPVPLSDVRSPDVSVDALEKERAFEARQRAERLQQKQQLHQAQMAEQIPQRAAAAEKARQRLEEKRAAAERRRARAEQAQQERAAAGRKLPAALHPLP